MAIDPKHDQPDAVGTPEGDNEFPPDQPLTRLPDNAEQIPLGSDPSETP